MELGQGHVPSPQPWHPCLDSDNAQEFQSCAGHEFPSLVRGLGPSQRPPQPCPHVLRPGVGAVCPGGPSASRISVIFSALPFPSLARLRREHQVQQQGHHHPTAFPTGLTPAGQGWRARKTRKVTRCDPLLWSLPVTPPLLGLPHLLLTLGHQNLLLLQVFFPCSALHDHGFPKFWTT